MSKKLEQEYISHMLDVEVARRLKVPVTLPRLRCLETTETPKPSAPSCYGDVYFVGKTVGAELPRREVNRDFEKRAKPPSSDRRPRKPPPGKWEIERNRNAKLLGDLMRFIQAQPLPDLIRTDDIIAMLPPRFLDQRPTADAFRPMVATACQQLGYQRMKNGRIWCVRYFARYRRMTAKQRLAALSPSPLAVNGHSSNPKGCGDSTGQERTHHE